MSQLGAHVEPEPGDLTPESGAQTDVAPLGRDIQKPAHELTADEDVDAVPWSEVAAMKEFRALLAAKVGFIVPASIFFIVYYFALPVLVGYFPSFMDQKVIGDVNLAYLFALSQFFMAWILAYIYMRRAAGFDLMVANIVAKLKSLVGGK